MGYFYDDMTKSSANIVRISGGILKADIYGVVEQDLVFNGSADWGHVHSIGTGALDKIADVSQALLGTNVTPVTQYGTRMKWQGSSPITITFTLTFLETDEKDPVKKIQTVGDIFSLIYPTRSKTTIVEDLKGVASSKESATKFATDALTGEYFLKAPNGYAPLGAEKTKGDAQNTLTLQIGEWFYAPNYWVIENVDPLVNKAISTEKRSPVMSKVTISLRTYQTPLESDIRTWFQGKYSKKSIGVGNG